MTIHPVHAARLKSPLPKKPNQLGRKQDVDIRNQHEPAARPANTGVLGDHLIER
jgi:hypothetical protein